MIQLEREELLALEANGPTEELLRQVRAVLAHRARLQGRYSRKGAANELMGSQAGGQSFVPFEYYIVNMAQGYLGGKAPVLSIRQGEWEEGYAERFGAAIARVQRYNDDAATFTELVHDYLVAAAAYLYVYESGKNEIVYTRLDPLQTVSLCGYGLPPEHLGLARLWKRGQAGREAEIFELVTERARTVWRDGKQLEQEPHRWEDSPTVGFEAPDGIAIFEPALSSIDDFERITNNIRSMTQYNDEAKLCVEGYRPEHPIGTPERAREEENLYRALCFFLEEGGKVSWLLKAVDYEGLLEVLKRHHEQITMLTGVPNMTDEAFSKADNASALGYKLYPIDQYSATTDRVFRKGLLRLWELVTNRFNLRGEHFDFRDIDIALQRNIPTDRDKSLNRAVTGYQSGLLSQETAINESQIEVDAKEEIGRIGRERAQEFETERERVTRGDGDGKG